MNNTKTRDTVYNLGKVYGAISKKYPDYNTTATYNMAQTNPAHGFASATVFVARKRDFKFLDALGPLIDKIDIDVTAAIPPAISLELQGIWIKGYFDAQNNNALGVEANRLKAGLTQQELADAIGVPRQSISRWERGVVTPKIDKLQAMADFLGCSVDTLRVNNG